MSGSGGVTGGVVGHQFHCSTHSRAPPGGDGRFDAETVRACVFVGLDALRRGVLPLTGAGFTDSKVHSYHARKLGYLGGQQLLV